MKFSICEGPIIFDAYEFEDGTQRYAFTIFKYSENGKKISNIMIHTKSLAELIIKLNLIEINVN